MSDARPTPGDEDSHTGVRAWLKGHASVWTFSFIAFILVYAGVNLLYGLSTSRPEVPVVDAPDRVVVYLNPIAVTPAEDRIKANVLVEPPDRLLRDGALTEELRVHLVTVPKTLSFDAGSRSWGAEVDIIAKDGSYELYPLDRYETGVALYASTTSEGNEQLQPSALVIWGKFPGWRVHSTTSREPLPAGWSIPPTPEVTSLDMSLAVLQVSRNGSTMSIVALLLAAMVVLAALALVVSRAVATRRRRIEATMASWFAALLFAMVPLRTNLPGAPPIGVWIDFLLFLWVILGLMIALAVFIASWLRYSRAPD
jgi:hypothetical protein